MAIVVQRDHGAVRQARPPRPQLGDRCRALVRGVHEQQLDPPGMRRRARGTFGRDEADARAHLRGHEPEVVVAVLVDDRVVGGHAPRRVGEG